MVVAAKMSYEVSRQKRVEENKKRMEELNLSKLVTALRPNTPNKPSPAKKQRVARQRLDLTAVRRSGRNADKSPRSYKEEPIEPSGRARRFGNRSYNSGPRNLTSRENVSEEDRIYAHERADELQSKLEPEFPSFVKPMLHSHVIQGFWLRRTMQSFKMERVNRIKEVFHVGCDHTSTNVMDPIRTLKLSILDDSSSRMGDPLRSSRAIILAIMHWIPSEL